MQQPKTREIRTKYILEEGKHPIKNNIYGDIETINRFVGLRTYGSSNVDGSPRSNDKIDAQQEMVKIHEI